jgi:hypothetical protein
MKSYDPQSAARDVLDVLRKHNTPLVLVDKVFQCTHELIQQETCLTNLPAGSERRK